MMTERRIGLYGGSFDPIHVGHLIIAQQALEHYELEQVIFIPCASPPHKPGGLIATNTERLEMLRGATSDNPAFAVSDIEIQRSGTTYTIDTIEALREQHTGYELFFLIGSDTLFELHSWKRILELLPLCRFVTLLRPGADVTPSCAAQLKLPPPWPEKLLRDVIRGRQIDIASSEIRARVSSGRSIRYLVPEAVADYIASEKLYAHG